MVPCRPPGRAPRAEETPLAFRRVAREEDVPTGRGLRVVLGELEIGLFRVGDAIHAMENACPHAGLPLSEGLLEGCVVTCTAHGWRFDVRSGFPPDDDDGFPIPCFPVRVAEGEVHVDVENPTNLRRRGRG